MLLSITEISCLNHQMLQNTEAETTESYKMIYNLIQSPTFRNVQIAFGGWISELCCIPVFSIPKLKVEIEVI